MYAKISASRKCFDCSMQVFATGDLLDCMRRCLIEANAHSVQVYANRELLDVKRRCPLVENAVITVFRCLLAEKFAKMTDSRECCYHSVQVYVNR